MDSVRSNTGRRERASNRTPVHRWPRAVVICAALSILVWLGCSDANQDHRGEVTGTVLLDGQPVVEGSITFSPAGGTSGPSAGTAIVDGKYHVEREKGPPPGDN